MHDMHIKYLKTRDELNTILYISISICVCVCCLCFTCCLQNLLRLTLCGKLENYMFIHLYR